MSDHAGECGWCGGNQGMGGVHFDGCCSPHLPNRIRIGHEVEDLRAWVERMEARGPWEPVTVYDGPPRDLHVEDLNDIVRTSVKR